CTRAAASVIAASIGYLRRPERFFFLRGGLGGAATRPPPPLELEPEPDPEGTASFSSAGLARPPRTSAPMPPDPFGPASPSAPPPPPPRPPPPSSVFGTAGTGGPIARLMKYCWPIVQVFVVIQ